MMDFDTETPSLPNPRALICPTAVEGQQYKNVLLIDKSVQEYQQFIDSANADTFPIVYSIMSSKTDLLALLKTNFTSISRLGLVFHSSSSGDAITFLDREPLFIVGEVSANQQFIKDVINEFQIKNIDYLACNTINYPNWTNYYDSITQDTGVVVGASNDKTGNIKYGGDWVLETTSENVELIYFTQSIEYYQYLLAGASFTVDNIIYTTGDNNTCSVTGYVTGLSGAITIPSTITDPQSNIGYTVTSIGNAAFDGCTGLTSITIPNSVTSIGWNAFTSCTNLSSITIPNSVTSIESGVFQNCYRLTSISIPSGLTSIQPLVFYGCGLTSIDISSNVTSIGENAFNSCRGLTDVYIPDSVTTIGAGAFQACYNLIPARIRIPTSLQTNSYSFYIDPSVTSLSIPGNVTTIENKTFNNCYLLKSITIPSSVTTIGMYAFFGCSELTSITIPSSVTSIAYGAFYACGLKSVIFINQNNLLQIGTDLFKHNPITTVTYYNTAVAAEVRQSISTLFDPVLTTFNYISGPPTSPTISSVSPVSGSTLGGTNVTITGTGFVSGATSVKFGGVDASTISIVSSTSITCTTPSLSAGLFNVTVTTPGGSATNQFTYVSPPTISSVSPVSGSTLGGTSVTITGTGFISGGTSVKFGGVDASTISIVSSTSITCTTPSLSAGLFNVTVTTPGGSATNQFTYVSPPTISAVSPDSAAVGTSVTITGTGFVGYGFTSVKFGGVDASNISIVSSTSITCTVPAGTGSVIITVTTPGGSVTTPFTYTIPTPPVSNICFPAGTPITCNQGAIPIERLNPEIHTIRGKKIVGITKTVTQDKYLVCFEKDALQKNVPSQKTIISKNHEIFYKSEMKKAKDFIHDFENVKKIKYTGEVLYNVLMEEPDKMMVNNLICETLHPVNSIAKLYKLIKNLSVEEQNIVISKFNKYVIENNVYNKKIAK